MTRDELNKLVEAEEFVSPEYKITHPESRERLLMRIMEAEGNAGLPQFSGQWEQISEISGWRVYMIHDPCHDDGKGFKDDRNTVMALHSIRGLWRIIGRELPRNMCIEIAKGQC